MELEKIIDFKCLRDCVNNYIYFTKWHKVQLSSTHAPKSKLLNYEKLTTVSLVYYLKFLFYFSFLEKVSKDNQTISRSDKIDQYNNNSSNITLCVCLRRVKQQYTLRQFRTLGNTNIAYTRRRATVHCESHSRTVDSLVRSTNIIHLF